MNEHPSHYTPSPEVPPELMPRLAAIVQVLAGMKTMAQAARDQQLSRNHFQTIVHRSLFAMIGSISPKAAGRPGKAPALGQLEKRLKKLEHENARLRKRVAATDELLAVAGQLLHGQSRPTQRGRQARKRSASDESASDSEPDGRRAQILDAVDRMRGLGLTIRRIAPLTGVDVATLRRWRAHPSEGARTARCVQPSRSKIERAQSVVRDLHGLIGAAALSHSVAGLSRRAAALIKTQTLRAIERERKTALTRITLSVPGAVRGLDAMYFATSRGPLYALIGADAAVPYRTICGLGAHYDATLVARTLRVDLERNGAPLVLRADRARAHDSPQVQAVLQAHGVLMLHGPPRYPCFYGQLERQNREHRAWLDALIDPAGASMQQLLEQMIYCLNSLWPRPTLAWKTSAQAWETRASISAEKREAFQKEVHDRTQRIACSLSRRGEPADRAERLAIEQTLERMGYMQRQIGGWC